MGQWRATIDIPATPRGLAAARHVLAALLPGWELSDQVCADAETVVSELVTNAIRHAPETDALELELRRHTNGIRVSLTDDSAANPTIREPSNDRPSGRGLYVVDDIASDWGADQHRGGKRIWVDLGVADVSSDPGPGSADSEQSPVRPERSVAVEHRVRFNRSAGRAAGRRA